MVKLLTDFATEGLVTSLKVIINRGVVGVSSGQISSLIQPFRHPTMDNNSNVFLII
jgi:hypothetical protein